MNNKTANIALEKFESLDEAAAYAASLVKKCACESVIKRGWFNVALSGGSTPVKLHERLVSGGCDIPWSKTSVYFGDERCVDPSDNASNFNMAARTLFAELDEKPAAIYPVIAGDSGDPRVAENYISRIKDNISADSEGVPQFDLILLGVGADGHTASLFPAEVQLFWDDRLVVKTQNAHADYCRVSFTLKLINAARNIIVLAAGDDKSSVIAQAHASSLSGRAMQANIASQQLQPVENLNFVYSKNV